MSNQANSKMWPLSRWWKHASQNQWALRSLRWKYQLRRKTWGSKTTMSSLPGSNAVSYHRTPQQRSLVLESPLTSRSDEKERVINRTNKMNDVMMIEKCLATSTKMWELGVRMWPWAWTKHLRRTYPKRNPATTESQFRFPSIPILQRRFEQFDERGSCCSRSTCSQGTHQEVVRFPCSFRKEGFDSVVGFGMRRWKAGKIRCLGSALFDVFGSALVCLGMTCRSPCCFPFYCLVDQNGWTYYQS